MNAVATPPLETPLAAAAVAPAEVLSALRTVLPAHAVLSSSENTTPYECDGLTAYRQRPMLSLIHI